MNSVSIPIVHPAFQNLKRSTRLLHLFAAIVIFTNALHEYDNHDAGIIFFWTLMFIAFDILVLTFFGRTILSDSPWINHTFRFMEVILFTGFSWIYYAEEHYYSFAFSLFLIIGYAWILYCETNVWNNERLSFHHIGIELPNLSGNKILNWSKINKIDTHIKSIDIITNESKALKFNFEKQLNSEELHQIHEFCKHYLKD